MLKIKLGLYSNKNLQYSNINWIFLILLLSLLFSSCAKMSLNYNRHEYITGTYYPNNTVKIEARPVDSPKELKILTIRQPIPVYEVGDIHIIVNWGPTGQYRDYMKRMNPPYADWAYDVVKSDIPGYGKYYVPVYILEQNGRLEFSKRNLSLFEWIQYHPILSLFVLIVILIIIIFAQISNFKKQQVLRIKNQKETEEERLKKIKDEELHKERAVERRKEIVLEVLNKLYKETAREVHKTSDNALLHELQDILNLLNSDILADAIIDSNITDFQNKIDFIESKLHKLKKIAINEQSKGNTD